MINKPVLLVIANEGYQQIEYNDTKKVLEAAGIRVLTASNNSIPAIAKDGSTTTVDITLKNINASQYAGIFFIGGPGALENLDTEESYHVIKQAYAVGILIGAICIATRILANAGILEGKKATGWDGDNQLVAIYQDADIQYIKESVVTDDTIITATGPSAASEFGRTIVHLLKKREEEQEN